MRAAMVGWVGWVRCSDGGDGDGDAGGEGGEAGAAATRERSIVDKEGMWGQAAAMGTMGVGGGDVDNWGIERRGPKLVQRWRRERRVCPTTMAVVSLDDLEYNHHHRHKLFHRRQSHRRTTTKNNESVNERLSLPPRRFRTIR